MWADVKRKYVYFLFELNLDRRPVSLEINDHVYVTYTYTTRSAFYVKCANCKQNKLQNTR